MRTNHVARWMLVVTLAVLLTACDAAPTPSPTVAFTETPLPLSGIRVSTLPPPPSNTPVPATNTPVPPTVAPIPSVTAGCTLQATFVADVTIPDGSAIALGKQFVKTWRVRNSGTCDWGRGVAAVFVEGDQLGGPTSVAMEPTDAGRSLDVSMTLKAPTSPGAYRGKWQLRAPNGVVLTGLTVSIVVAATPTPTGPPTVTPKPTPIPTFAASIDSFVGLWLVVEGNFGNNLTDTKRLQQLQINKSQSGTRLEVSPATTFPNQFGVVEPVPASYPGGPRMEWEFDDPTRGHVYLTFTINKLCNATARLRYPGFEGRFILYQPQCRLPGED